MYICTGQIELSTRACLVHVSFDTGKIMLLLYVIIVTNIDSTIGRVIALC